MEIVNNVLSILSSVIAIIISLLQFKDRQQNTESAKVTLHTEKVIKKIETDNHSHGMDKSNEDCIGFLVCILLFFSIVLICFYHMFSTQLFFISLISFIIISVINYFISIKLDAPKKIITAFQLFVPTLLFMLNKFCFNKLNLTNEYINTLKDIKFKEMFSMFVSNIIVNDTNLHNYGVYCILSVLSVVIIICLSINSICRLICLLNHINIVKSKFYGFVFALNLFFLLSYIMLFIYFIYIRNYA